MRVLLLDTHTLLWYAEGGGKPLAPSALEAMEQARTARTLFISSISIWEIGMLCAKGRLTLSSPVDEWLRRVMAMTTLRELPLDLVTALESTRLPGACHGDPADRFLIAGARVHDLVLATADGKIIAYGNAGHVRVLEI